MKIIYVLSCITATLIMTSCATASLTKYKAVGRVKKYEFHSYDIPAEFDGFKIVFASDFHYESKFTHKRLLNSIKLFNSLHPDVLLLGGDYPGINPGSMDTLFSELSKIKSEYGIYAVMGNHDTGKYYKPIIDAMHKYGISIMQDNGYSLIKDSSRIIITGVKDSFDKSISAISPSQLFPKEDFVIMVTHSPDYVEDKDVSNANLVLAGHTHGGQISMFKKISPISHSKYGSRFLTGFKQNSKGTPIIITNGIGTSRKNIRLFTPSEIVLITLRRETK